MDDFTLYEGAEPYIFISYRRTDAGRIRPILTELHKSGYRFWYDKGIHAGESYTASLGEHITKCGVFVPFLSRDFIASKNCLQEVQHARNKDIVPVWLEKLDRESLPEDLKFIFTTKQDMRVGPDETPAEFVKRLERESLFQRCRAVTPSDGVTPAQIVTQKPMEPSGAFVGRAQIMNEIEARFRRGESVVILQGMGGIGKSEICRKLFRDYTHGGRVSPAPYVGWAMWNQSPPDTFYMQFLDIDEENITEHWKRVQARMRELGPNLLLFLDNADNITDEDEARLTTLGCRFLITSRRTERSERVRGIAVDRLTQAECRLLYRRALYGDEYADDAPEAALDEIIELAAGHTLTVRLLAKTQLAADMEPPELLAKLKECGFNLNIPETVRYLHNPESADANDDGRRKFFAHMSHIFDLSTLRDEARLTFFARLKRFFLKLFGLYKDNSSSLRVLQGFSLLAPNTPIPVKTAQKWLGLENLNALNRAVNAGWLDEKMENNHREVSIHPVISDVVRHNAPPDADMIDAIAGWLYADMYVGTGIFTTKLPVAKHAIALDRVTDYLITKNYAKMLHQTGYLLLKQADYDTALSYLKRAAEATEKVLGTEHPNTATSYNNIGGVYQSKGDYDSALQWYQKALQIDEKVLGPEHPHTATSYNNIGMVYQSQGDYESALQWHQKALQIDEKVLGTNHPDTAVDYNNIGGVYQSKGDYDSALQWYHKSLQIREKVLGPEHPNTATIYHNIGTLYCAQGDYAEALKWLEKALTIRLKVLGAEHPYTKNTQKWVDEARQRLSDENKE